MFESSSKNRKSWNGRQMVWQWIPNTWSNRWKWFGSCHGGFTWRNAYWERLTCDSNLIISTHMWLKPYYFHSHVTQILLFPLTCDLNLIISTHTWLKSYHLHSHVTQILLFPLTCDSNLIIPTHMWLTTAQSSSQGCPEPSSHSFRVGNLNRRGKGFSTAPSLLSSPFIFENVNFLPNYARIRRLPWGEQPSVTQELTRNSFTHHRAGVHPWVLEQVFGGQMSFLTTTSWGLRKRSWNLEASYG